ncbi:MAG: phosphatidylglycerophosphatase A [Pseudobdellovibrionaceae bacterium]
MNTRRGLHLVATYLGIGYAKKAPGTVATFATIPLVILLSWAGPFLYMAAVLLLIPLAIIAAAAYEQDHLHADFGDGHDRSEIVIDEVVGFLITMVWLPMTWQSLLMGFLLFRFFDILKPFPIGYLDRKVPGGLGVVVDDIAAGIFASLILQAVYSYTSILGQQ